MKVISGTLKGLLIPTLKTKEYRPTTGKFKEAIFSIISSGKFGNFIENSIILDLFAGTGSLGIEALSRGANHVTFVDINSQALNLIKSFGTKYDLLNKMSFFNTNATNIILSNHKYDIIFIDPPYSKNIVPTALNSLLKSDILSPNALFIIEVASHEIIDLPEWCKLLETRKYGNSKMIIATADESIL